MRPLATPSIVVVVLSALAVVVSTHAMPPVEQEKELLPLLPAHLQNLHDPTSPLLSRAAALPLGGAEPPVEQRMKSQRDLVDVDTEKRQAMHWEKQIEYSGKTFFDGWEFFSEPDPTHGLINYVPSDQAFADGLVFWTGDGTPGLQVEHWRDTPVGMPRNSVRIHSKALFAGGLFVIDIRLMPWGCSVWPAFWTLGYEKEWPHAGEIDIISNDRVRILCLHILQQEESTELKDSHTTPGCKINSTHGLFTGDMKNEDCDALNSKSGCSIVSASDTSYGMRFNELGGGAFALLWDGDGVTMWDWTRSRIPADLLADRPNPRIWGAPAAAWDASTCNPYEFFGPQQLILNINLCGEWAGALYHQYSYCPGTCEEYAANHLNLNNTVMLVNSIKVFQQAGTDAPMQQADTVANLTGVGAPIPGNGTNFNRDPSAARLSSRLSWILLELVMCAGLLIRTV